MTTRSPQRAGPTAHPTANVMRIAFRRVAAVTFAVSLSAIGAAAQAGQFGVRVLDESGEPVAGAAVCIGLEGNYRQFGALFTSADGIASADVPNVPLVVTVSKTRFSGVRMGEPARGFNLLKDVTLVEGMPGPRCRAGSSLAGPGIPDIRIDDIGIDRAASSTVLNAEVSGDPTHYRVGADADFVNASWQRFSESIPVPGELVDAGEVYLQLRRYAGDSTGWVEARSAVTTVELPVSN